MSRNHSVGISKTMILSLMFSYELLQKRAITSHENMSFEVIYQNTMNLVQNKKNKNIGGQN